MVEVKLSLETYRDKVYGCWIGKNAGGTVGGPLERIWGQEEMFDVWWYPKLVEGGIPNDDLEIQLVWLQALKERGINLTARDLAEYWLDCIGYNPDEYGLHKTNLRKGLQPPISGWYNNWFKDCMGSPIRSEIWACIAPGAPHIAARYAYQDAICDHAGGESVYGEIFNAVLESAAFVMDDRMKLLKIGLSAIPEDSLTSKAIRIVIESYNRGLSWKEARERVKEEMFSPVAQFSPINLGFQTIGLLYGEDFGDAICKAVNCGWDTDCTGATVGAIWGIINGRSGLPEKWIKPLGDEIVISKGIRNLQAPTNLCELTDETCKIGMKVLAVHDASVRICDLNDFSAAEDIIMNSIGEIKKLWGLPPNRLDFDLISVKASITYLDGPAILPEVPNRFVISVKNLRSEFLSGKVIVDPPFGWTLKPEKEQRFKLQAGERLEFVFSLCTSIRCIETSNHGTVKILLDQRPDVLRLPLNFVGGFRWLISEVFGEPLSLDIPFPPENDVDSMSLEDGWEAVSWPENALEIEPLFEGQPGIIYLRHFIYSPEERRAIIGVPNNSRMKLWLNGEILHETEKIVPLRPNYSGDGSNYARATLKKGWNHIMVKILRGEKPIEAHFTIAHEEWSRGMADIIQHRFPWE